GAKILVGALRGRGRRWAVPAIGEAMLYVCGEVNIIKGGKDGPDDCRILEEAEEEGLREQDLLTPLVINPAHTLSILPAMRGKRAWLSKGGLLIHTANTHTAWVKDGKRKNASHTAAMVWVRGKTPDKELRTESPIGDGYTLK